MFSSVEGDGQGEGIFGENFVDSFGGDSLQTVGLVHEIGEITVGVQRLVVPEFFSVIFGVALGVGHGTDDSDTVVH